MAVKEFFNQIGNYKQNMKIELDDKRMVSFLEHWSLDVAFLNKNLNELSGGERTRVGLSVIEWLNRPFVLLDEPTATLDGELKELVVEWVRGSKQTFIITSHDTIWQRDFRTIKKWEDANL